MSGTRKDPDMRFWRHVSPEPNSGCWLWTGCLSTRGYARFGAGGLGNTVYGHRWSYERFVGPVPTGMHLDHRCRVRSCVNPAHLEAVTPAENLRRGEQQSRTHCPRGHAYDHANTAWNGNARRCRACDRERYHERRAAA